MNNWYVITGGPSSGKTTIIDEFSKRGYRTLPEVARLVIDEELAAGRTIEQIRSDEEGLQQRIIRRRFELQSDLPTDEVIFFDRGTHDSLAYLRYYDYKVPPELLDACNSTRYKKVFLLEQLANYSQDYGRTEDKAFASAMQRLHASTYTEYGMEPIIIPFAHVSERVAIITTYVDRVDVGRMHG